MLLSPHHMLYYLILNNPSVSGVQQIRKSWFFKKRDLFYEYIFKKILILMGQFTCFSLLYVWVSLINKVHKLALVWLWSIFFGNDRSWKSAKIWLSKSIVNVKGYLNVSKKKIFNNISLGEHVLWPSQNISNLNKIFWTKKKHHNWSDTT